jgi:uncharacterized membrane protein YkgB
MSLDIESLDGNIASTMKKCGVRALQISLAVIFIWFGALKIVGLSPAADLVLATVNWMPFFTPQTWLKIIGWWEVIIGISFLFHKTKRIAIALLAMQMFGTFLPLIILPEITFQAGRFPYAPTIEGQYIIKNLLIISAALVVGGTVRQKDKSLNSKSIYFDDRRNK